ncbi:hypothetical protein [Blastococcus tunisiensis]|uniref:Excreted virulence factor EspC, type VII ESX diderm n=1 Tax=Blastococcus tunisiensis TaxID=1798228 RepID=A0A1I1XT64_9ACTN|nr:hypothetical protein [Blastococcus sp. DSM 46838]SFE10567.1 hypothetical protein SAMN05216574_102166 [Blastococcus sp. DSM 46838]
MSSPTPPDAVLVHPAAVTALAGELTGLGGELLDDAEDCRALAGRLPAALEGEPGWTAGAAAAAWAGLLEVLAERTAALARTLAAVVQAYLDEDARLAGGIDGRRRLPR